MYKATKNPANNIP